MKRAPLLFLLTAACVHSAPVQEDVPASREDVTASLYKQLDLVLARQATLEANNDPGTAAEREELLRLAAEIAVRIVRIDPDADVRHLVHRVEQAR